jgi:hypothetical protein
MAATLTWLSIYQTVGTLQHFAHFGADLTAGLRHTGKLLRASKSLAQVEHAGRFTGPQKQVTQQIIVEQFQLLMRVAGLHDAAGCESHQLPRSLLTIR